MTTDDQLATQASSSEHRLGNYQLLRSLGYGGFASVYLGEHVYLKRLAAIKVLRTVLTEREMGHFLAEARLLANLSHPHIVRVLEFAVAQRQALKGSAIKEHVPFLVMDYAPGGNLRSLYPSGTRLALDVVINTIEQVADALQYAHERNIIHRDIKPENLLLNERREIMLSDFGLALFAPSPDMLSRQGMAGTLAYTAPEQLQGRPSFESDQYSLAIVAYEWLCGSRPFGGEDVEVMLHQVSSSPPRLQSKNPLITAAVEEVILKALAKNPQQRYPSVQAFAQALAKAGQPSAIRSTTRPVRVVKMPSSSPKRDFPAFHYFAQKAVVVPESQKAALAPVDQGVTVRSTDPEVTVIATNDKVAPKHQSFDLGLVDHANPLYELDLPGRPGGKASSSNSTSRNRLRMIQKVRAFWVHGVLSQSLRGGSFIALGLDERQDAVASSWSLAHHPSEKYDQSLAPGTTITDIYDQSGGELLILGEAGSGKTTLLLELARNLLDRAERDESGLIPVVLPLSSWTEKQQPLEEWLIEELSNKYQVPHLLAEYWVRNEMILPLLDGLDEVTANVRSACVVAINTYKEAHGLSSLVVCSRLTEYLLFPPRVLLRSAIVVRPLTMQQIEAYLRRGLGKKAEVLYQVLRNDLVLQQLAMKPLILNMLVLGAQDKSSEELVQLCLPEGRYQRIFSMYVEQMLHRYQTTTSSSPQQMKHGLAYLAMQMQRHSQTVFYLEQLQPDWIEDALWMQCYRWFAVMLPGTFIGGLVGILINALLFHAGSAGAVSLDFLYGAVMGYMFSGIRVDHPAVSERIVVVGNFKRLIKGDYIRTVLFVGLLTFFCIGVAKGSMAGLANGLYLGALSLPLRFFFQKSSKAKVGANVAAPQNGFPFSSAHFRRGALIGIACGPTSIITMLVNQNLGQSSIPFLVSLFIRDSVCDILLGMLLSLLLVNNDGFIHRAEVVSWSWKIFWKHMRRLKYICYEVLLSIGIGVIFAGKQLLQGNMGNLISAGFCTGILIVVGMRLLYAASQALSKRNLDNNYRFRPNEGIKRSLYYGLVGAVIGTFVTILLSIATSGIAGVTINGPGGMMQGHIMLASIADGFSNALCAYAYRGLDGSAITWWAGVPAIQFPPFHSLVHRQDATESVSAPGRFCCLYFAP